MAFLRFILSEFDPDSGVPAGLFQCAYELAHSPDVLASDRGALRTQLAWFESNLPTPERFNRSSSKGFYRRRTKGIAWFRDTAIEHLARMHELKRIVEAAGHPVRLISTDRVGYVVYEDEHQVIAEPFADTPRA